MGDAMIGARPHPGQEAIKEQERAGRSDRLNGLAFRTNRVPADSHGDLIMAYGRGWDSAGPRQPQSRGFHHYER